MAEKGKEAQNSRREIVIDPYYEGPTDIAQGGYISGRMAVYLESDTVEVTMKNPTPMGKPLILDTTTPDRVFVFEGERLLNEARPAQLDLDIPEHVSLETAKKASLRHITEMPFPNCFGCGSGRTEDDGLHLRSGPVEERNIVAIDWVPRAAAVGASEGEEVPEPVVWSAMECPTARVMQFSGIVKPEQSFLLGRMTSKVNRLPKVGRPYFFMGWPIERDGRKIEVAGSLHNEAGEVLVLSEFLFITLKEGMDYDSFIKGKV